MHAHRLRTAAVAVLLMGVSLCGLVRAEDVNPASIHSKGGAWPLYRQWNTAETRHFAEWIGNIYEKKVGGTTEQRLAKLERVLTDPEMNLLFDPAFAGEPSNPQVDMDSIRAMHGIVDCQKLMVSLTAYYSCRRGLPFMVSHVRAVDGGDLRTADCTIPVGGTSCFDYDSPRQFFVDCVTGTNTGNLRVEPFGKNAGLSDTCPVAIDREHLLPGCVYYLDGHVLVLASVDEHGEPRFLDATVAVSRDLYTFNGMNAVSGLTPKRSENAGREYAGCFRGFRVLRYPIAETDKSGNVTRVRRRTDAEMEEFGWSTEQYDKFEELVKQGKIADNGLACDSMHQFIRHRLSTPEPIRVADLIREYVKEARDLLAAREQSVQQAWADVQKNGPIQFPEGTDMQNIYRAGGRWGEHATALTDAEFRARYFDFCEALDRALSWYDMKEDYIDLEGLFKDAIWNHSDLAWAAIVEKDRAFAATTFEYTASTGEKRTLSLADIERRLYDLSFDPNHPPELRWGAKPGTDEAEKAPETATPVRGGKTLPMAEAYRYEAYYRSLTRRETEETPLRCAATSGFYVRETINDFLWPKWHGLKSPPIVPHGGKAAYMASMPEAEKKTLAQQFASNQVKERRE
jgi:hypothetical protein